MELGNWYIAVFLAIFISFFVAALGLITGNNVLGLEIKILYRSVNLFMIIIRLIVDVVILVFSTLLIVFSSFGLGIINELLNTNFKVQLFYDMQSQALAGSEGIYLAIMGFMYDISIMNEAALGVDVNFTPQQEFFALTGGTGEDLIEIWNGSFGAAFVGVLSGLEFIFDEVANLWEDFFKPRAIIRSVKFW